MKNFSCSDELRSSIAKNLESFDRCTMDYGSLKRAAVSLTLVDFQHRGHMDGLVSADAQSAAIILTRRAGGLKSHGGQWAFPGGKIEPGEEPGDTALRELYEEVGLPLSSESVLGYLDDYVTRSGYHITPVVTWGGATRKLQKNVREVSSIHRIPLAELFHSESPLLSGGVEDSRPVLYMVMGSTCVASPTAAIWYQFREVALCGRTTRVAHFDQPFFAWN